MGEGFFIVFDLTNENSLDEVNQWIDSVKNQSKNPKFVILGNKDDLKENRIPDDIINMKLGNYKDYFIKTSAMKNKNIKEAIEKMIDLIENENTNNNNEKEYELQKNNSLKIKPKNHADIKKSDKTRCC